MDCLPFHVVETGLKSGLPALHPPLGFQMRHVPQMQNNLMFRLLPSCDDVYLLVHAMLH